VKANGLNVLVTGGAGFIGSEMVHQLIAIGCRVVVVDNLSNGKKENLKGLPKDKVRFVKEDVRDAGRMTKLMRGSDIVFHLACLGVRHSLGFPLENHDVNATATLGLLSVAKNENIKRFVYVSSSEVFGTARWVPMTEDYPPSPMTVYGASKLAGECYTRAFWHSYEYPTVVVRPFNTYGPRCHHEGDSGEVIPKFLLRCMSGKPMIAFGDGCQTRDFTFVSDTAYGIIQAGLHDNAIGTTINIGSGREVSINDLAKKVAAVAKRPDATLIYEKARPGDVLRLCADIRKARMILGFRPKVTLSQGLKQLKEWYMTMKQSPEELLKSEIVRNWGI